MLNFNKLLLTFLFVGFIATSLNAQTVYPENYFIAPIFIPLNLAGNFGEIRVNHFHSGIDIKTNGCEGEPVVASADGFISRIKVSAFGFGKALYIKHPGGYTTVYGHLQRFNDSLQSYIEKIQYDKESFEADVQPDSNLFPLRKGQLIAYSGNTGGSEGPHLHFEIRDNFTEHPFNPLLFGFNITDTISPVIVNIKAYQLSGTTFGFITDTTFNIPLSLKEKRDETDTIFVFENTAFSVETFDRMNDTTSKLSVNKIELLLDDSLIYLYHFDEFGFDEVKYVNANIDYAERITTGKKFVLLYRLPGNFFREEGRKIGNEGRGTWDEKKAGTDTVSNGLIELTDSTVHRIEIIVTDNAGNVSSKKFYLQKSPGHFNAPYPHHSINFTTGSFISYKKTPEIKRPDVRISFAPFAIYNVYPFEIKRKPKLKGTFSLQYSIGDETIPVHTWINLSLKPLNLPENLYSKTLIVAINKNEGLSAEESSYANGWVSGKIKHLGKFSIAVDTTPPKLSAPKIITDTTTNQCILTVKMSDELSGIKSYRAMAGGKWLLMDYDAKTESLNYSLNSTDDEKKTEIIIEAEDRKGNKSVVKSEMVF